MHGSRWKLLMMTMMVMNMIKPCLQKTGILLNSKGHVTTVESMVTKVYTDMMGRVSFQKMADVGSVLRKDINCVLVRSLKLKELSLKKLI